jgi:hypothetical protein
MHSRREGMLRPEFRDWYPNLNAGQWYPADELTTLVRNHLRHGSPQWRAEGRVPSDDHFVFRGDTPRQGVAGHSRRSDPPLRRVGGEAPNSQLDA